MKFFVCSSHEARVSIAAAEGGAERSERSDERSREER
jgi:hypothetical protein